MSGLSWLGRRELAELSCPYCGRRLDPDDERMLAAEAAWGFVGAGLRNHGERIGVLLLNPIPDPREAATGQVALVTCLWVMPEVTRRGYGRRLVQAAAAAMLSQDVDAILARGARVKKECAAPPAEFLRAAGFSRPLDERLWRLELDATVADRTGLRGLLGWLMASVRPIGPEPAHRTVTCQSGIGLRPRGTPDRSGSADRRR